MADGNNNADVTATEVKGSNETNIGLSIEEGRQAGQSTGPSASDFGVTEQQFDKYYKDGNYNWEAHAKELQFQQQQKADKGADEKAPEQVAPETEGEAQEIVENAGLNWDALGDKIVADGDIGADDYKALESIGIPENIVKQYVDGIKLQAETHQAAVYEHFGGQEQFEHVKAWAQANYSQAELNALSTQLSSPDEWKLAADLLTSKAGASPKDGRVYGPNAAGSTATTAPQAYANQQEMIADQRKPEYKRDPAFRQQVMERARVSNFDSNPRAHPGGM